MNKFKYCLLVLALVIGGSLFAQSQRELEQLMHERNEYYFMLTVQEPSEIQAINEICSVDGIDGTTVVCYANQQEYDKLLLAGYQPTLLTPPSLREEAEMWQGGDRATYQWDSYLTYGQYVSMMEGFPSSTVRGRTCTLLDLGTLSTSNHRKLLGVRINNGQPDGKPKFLYSSTIHGDELTGMILMLRLINELCTSTDSRIVNLVNNLDIYILPLTNPDGTYYGGNNTVNGARRYNGNDVDLNRNYKDYFKGAHPDGNSYQDETLWTMQLADEVLFTMGANYHGGAEVMNYPWDADYTNHADKDWYEYVCTEYVRIARKANASYMTDTYTDGVTNGATWYVISGGRQDYMNAYAQCREVTVECSSTKTPSASQLPNFWNYNHNSMLAFMEQCLNGVHGFVYDAQTQEPLQGVTVTVQNHDVNNSFVTTHSIGDFHRPIKGDTYTFEFSKAGYYPQTVEVTVADGQRVDLDPIYLEGGAPIPEEPDIVIMHNGTVETCNALFYDSGGEDANYGNNLDYTLTIYPSCTGAKARVSFSRFNVEANYDFLYIYDGTSTSATQIGQYSGTTPPETVTATNEAGALTFRFTSDYALNKSGWVATVSCEMPPSIELADDGINNSDLISEDDGSAKNVLLAGRTLWKDGAWNTLCLPFDLTEEQVAAQLAPASEVDGVSGLMELDTEGFVNGHQTGVDATDGTLYLAFKNATSITAGVPYIIKWDGDGTDNLINPVFTGVTLNASAPTPVTFTGGQFVGQYNYQRFETENTSILFLGEDGEDLYWPQPDLTDPSNPVYPSVGAFRAYFQMEEDTKPSAFRLGYGENSDDATGIVTVKVNGEARDSWYSVNGVKLNGAPKRKGLYIHNGVKVVIK